MLKNNGEDLKIADKINRKKKKDQNIHSSTLSAGQHYFSSLMNTFTKRGKLFFPEPQNP